MQDQNHSGLLGKGIFASDVSFGAIAQDRFLGMVANSMAVFDFGNHDQSGYTMPGYGEPLRGKKLITNNHRISDEPFLLTRPHLCVQ